jgi:DNA-binding NarL/FixJ family response regulator
MPAACRCQARRVRLTGRELHVLELVALGLSNLEIGQTLHIAGSSVKTHVGHLLAKLGLADRVHLVIFAYEHGVIQPGMI